MQPRTRLLAIFLTVFSIVALSVLLTTNKSYLHSIEHLSGNTYIMLEDTRTNNFFKIPWFSKTTEDKYKNVCINGKDRKNLSKKDQLKEFIQGPCLPVVLVPGLLGSRLKLQIDCEVLRKENPEIFKSCGWSTCKSWNWFGQMPQEKYTLWISDFLGPMNVVRQGSVKCWANLVALKYEKNEGEIARRFQSPIGTTVTVYGQTDGSSQCGFEAVNNILSTPFQMSFTKGYSNMRSALEHMGYQVGLTLYAAPYDWRKTTLANGIGKALNDTLHQANGLTGKPSVLVAHSLGNFGSLYVLNSMDAALKKKLVHNYVSLMNPLNGSPKSLLTLMGGNNEYLFRIAGSDYGIDYAGMKKFVQGSSGFFDLLPKDPFNQFKNDKWLQTWKARVDIEKSNNVSTVDGKASYKEIVDKKDLPYSWFPNSLKTCFRGFVDREDKCAFNQYDWTQTPMVTINKEVFTGSSKDLHALFEKYVGTTSTSAELFMESQSNNIYLLRNPEVPVTLVYGSHIPTGGSFEWDYNPLERINQTGKFANPTIFNKVPGDATVPSVSSLLPAMKWGYEYEHKDDQDGIKTAQPVKVVEYCSILNNKDNIYDEDTDQNSPFKVTKNEYMGLKCDCLPKENGEPTDGLSCDHAGALIDSHVVRFVQNIAIGNVMNTAYNQTDAAKLNEEQLDRLMKKCPIVDVGLEHYKGLISEPDLSDEDDKDEKGQKMDAIKKDLYEMDNEIMKLQTKVMDTA